MLRCTASAMAAATGRAVLCCSLQVGIIRGAPLLENGVGTANTSLVFHAGRLLALHEGDLPYQVRAADSYVACLALPGHSLSP